MPCRNVNRGGPLSCHLFPEIRDRVGDADDEEWNQDTEILYERRSRNESGDAECSSNPQGEWESPGPPPRHCGRDDPADFEENELPVPDEQALRYASLVLKSPSRPLSVLTPWYPRLSNMKSPRLEPEEDDAGRDAGGQSAEPTDANAPQLRRPGGLRR